MIKRMIPVLFSVAVLAFAARPGMAQTPLKVDAQAAQGFAAPGNDQAANFLIIVTDPLTGAAITNLVQTDFSIIDHFAIPGQACGFTNQIVLFGNVGTGAYQIQVKLHSNDPHIVCAWVKADYLAQVRVSIGVQRLGQAAVKLSVH